jgi:di/tricarboxylate transporter
VLVGVVPHEEAFAGFGNEIVVIVASALVVSAGVARSGVVEAVVGRLGPRIRSVQGQIILLVAAVALMSAMVKNIGALAIMLPVALQMARASGASPSCYLMPMAFASLLGGLITLVGTSPNIIVAELREEIVGEPFGMFDYAPVGLGLTLAGVAFLAIGYRLLPSDRKAAPAMGEALDIKGYVTEARVPFASAAEGKTVEDLVRAAEGEVTVTSVVRGRTQPQEALPGAVLRKDDIVLLEGAPDALERTIKRAELELEGTDRPVDGNTPTDNIGVVEAVIAPGSVLIGTAAGRMALHERFGLNLIAISRSGERFTERLRDIVMRGGDVIVLQGALETMPDKLRELGCLPLAERPIPLGLRRSVVPVAILAGAMLLTAFGMLPVATAFFAAAVIIMLSGALPLRDAYSAVEWPILIMLGALIPVSEAIRTTGGTGLVAGWLSGVAQTLPPHGALALIMVVAMAVTPFLNNAATVLVMAPIAAGFAKSLGYTPDPFLMAVAVGAACDFLTPIGHQCNTLVMGPGGYRFGDYWRLGLPLSLIVVGLGVPLISMVWPMTQ